MLLPLQGVVCCRLLRSRRRWMFAAAVLCAPCFSWALAAVACCVRDVVGCLLLSFAVLLVVANRWLLSLAASLTSLGVCSSCSLCPLLLLGDGGYRSLSSSRCWVYISFFCCCVVASLGSVVASGRFCCRRRSLCVVAVCCFRPLWPLSIRRCRGWLCCCVYCPSVVTVGCVCGCRRFSRRFRR